MQAYQKGKLLSWNEARGFGFIAPENGAKKVFLHISALKKHGRHPQKGDTIYYQLNFDRQNRIQATHAYIEGVQYQRRSPKPSSPSSSKSTRSRQNRSFNKRKSASKLRYRMLPALILVIVLAVIYSFSQKKTPKYRSAPPVQSTSHDVAKYHCSGKTRCSQMTSCEEAKFYLYNCPGVEIDGDGDGLPCESQWCGH